MGGDEFGIGGIDWSQFSPWELINTMDALKQEDPVLANQIGLGLDSMGYNRGVIENAAATGQPMPPPPMSMSPRQIYPEGPAIAGAPVNGLDMPPPAPQLTGVPPGAVGGDITRPLQNIQNPTIPDNGLGSLVYPSKAPNVPGMQAPAGETFGPPAPAPQPQVGVDPRVQAQRALAAQQGIKAPVEQRPMHQDLRQAPAAPKQGEVKHGATAIQMLLAAALGSKAGGGLRVPTLGGLASGVRQA